MRSVAIIGGGFCGIAVAVRLLSAPEASVRVVLFERASELGGLAYTTEHAEHLLNLAADRMSLFPERPNDCVTFAEAAGFADAALRFLPRSLYGAYLRARLAAAVSASGDRFRRVTGEVERARPSERGWTLSWDDGEEVFDAVLLATGNGPPIVPRALRAAELAPWVVREPYAVGALERISPDASVLVLGLRLTAFDAIASLRSAGHRGAVVALSRRGTMPSAHLPEVRWKGAAVVLDEPVVPFTADGLAAWFRAAVARAEATAIPWQAVTDAVRPRVAELWQRLPAAERSKFLAVHRGAWEQVRHRVPVESADALEDWSASGLMESVAGEVVEATPVGAVLFVTIRTAGGAVSQLMVGAVVCCAGRLSDPRRFDAPLWKSLLRDGLVTVDDDGLGVLSDANGAVVGAPAGLFAIGSLVRPRTYESTAVPELAAQAKAMAELLLGSASE